MSSEFKQGIKDGIPIAIGYFSVSFSFGIIAVKQGISILQAVLTSASNITSAGQFAGLQIIVAGGTILEMILTQFIVNLRYALMSLSLSQKLDKNVSIKQRLIMAFANTDEIFAAAMAHNKAITMPYMAGLQSLPVLGWTFGTAVGAVAGDLLPIINSVIGWFSEWMERPAARGHIRSSSRVIRPGIRRMVFQLLSCSKKTAEGH